MKVLFWLPIFVFFTCCPARAVESGVPGNWKISNEFRQGDCTLRVLLESETISSVDDLGVRIEAEAPEAWRVQSVNFDPGQFRILEQTRSLYYRADSGRVMTRIDYRLEPFLPHDYRIPGPRVSFIRESPAGEAAKDPETADLASGELAVRVVSATPDAPVVPDIISAPVDLPEEGNLRNTLCGAVALLVAAAGVFWLIRSRRVRGSLPPTPSAREIAEDEIHDLLESGLLDRKEFPLFFSRLSGAILSYAGHNGETGGNGRRENKEEPMLGAGFKSAAIKEFLHISERVRFAGHEPSGDEVRRALECCTAILKEDEPHLGAPDAASISRNRRGV